MRLLFDSLKLPEISKSRDSYIGMCTYEEGEIPSNFRLEFGIIPFDPMYCVTTH